jgi:Fe-S oxidoreductase
MTTRLPLLTAHRASLETCVYCPRLCRAECPVSNAEPNEALTPWGKMATAFHVARGDLADTAESAAVAWACTGCKACRQACDHHNDVASVLLDARAHALAAGRAPPAAEEVARTWAAKSAALRDEVARLERELPPPSPTIAKAAPVALLVGCGYVKSAPEIVADAALATSFLADAPVRLVAACCGGPLLAAGAHEAFLREAARVDAEVAALSPSRFVVVDPGCARALGPERARLGAAPSALELFVDLAASRVGRLASGAGEAVRYHDSCELGRGLGRYDEPRKVLERVTGAPVRELPRSRERAECSGGGRLLPVTYPEASRAIGAARVREHREAGGGTLVTSCSQSRRRLRAQGEPARDLVELVAESVRARRG